MTPTLMPGDVMETLYPGSEAGMTNWMKVVAGLAELK